jgi:hypothetical protein
MKAMEYSNLSMSILKKSIGRFNILVLIDKLSKMEIEEEIDLSNHIKV